MVTHSGHPYEANPAKPPAHLPENQRNEVGGPRNLSIVKIAEQFPILQFTNTPGRDVDLFTTPEKSLLTHTGHPHTQVKTLLPPSTMQ